MHTTVASDGTWANRLLSRLEVQQFIRTTWVSMCQGVKEGGHCALLKWGAKPRKLMVKSDSLVTKTPQWKWYGSLKSRQQGRGVCPFLKKRSSERRSLG